MEELVSLIAGPQKEKRLAGPENAIARGKKKRKISSCGSRRKKKLCQTRTGGKQVYITQKKYAIAGLREKKSRVRPAHCYAGREDPRNI